MSHFSKSEQLLLCLFLGLLLAGWAVKAYRTAYLTATVVEQKKH
jgi:hypothetical protein